jgi:hypothetical protein
MKNALLVACITVGSALCPFVAQASKPVQTLSQIVHVEGDLRDSVGYMANDIKRHLCQTRNQVIDDINGVFNFDSRDAANKGYVIDLNVVDSELAKYSRNQIIAAEVAELHQMEGQPYIVTEYPGWLSELKAAKKSGNKAEEAKLLAVSPHVVVGTFIQLASFVPYSLLDGVFNALDYKSCKPINVK